MLSDRLVLNPAVALYEFGPFRYDSTQRLLTRGGATVALVPKALETLHALIEARGRVLEKAELMRIVWPDTTVEEIGLARNISILRKALGDEADGGAYIETIPRRGYRFAAELREIQPAPPDAVTPERRRLRRWPVVLAASLVILAIAGVLIYWQFYVPSRHVKTGTGAVPLAVVPFATLSPDVRTFSDGFSELLATELTKSDTVHVFAPSTVRRHQKAGVSSGLMGRLLGCEVLVEGTVQQIGNYYRFTARLVDVHTGKIIWADHIDQPVSEPAAAQTNAAQAVSAQVLSHLAVREPFTSRE